MALEFLRGPRTAPVGYRRLYTRESVTPKNSIAGSQNGTEQKIDNSVEIDYDLLVSNVENMLTADRESLLRKEIQPKDLLIRSNPGLFGNMHQDITNPREMYNFLSKRKLPSLADDMQIHVRHHKTFEDETFHKSNSFKEFAKMPKKYHFHSHQDLTLSEKKDPSFVALNSNAPYVALGEVTKTVEREKTTLTKFNLPSLDEGERNKRKEEFNEKEKTISFPVIQSTTAEPTTKMSNKRQNTKVTNNADGKTKTNVTFSNKIDKWFSEMPADVTDRANRAIMVDLIKERINSYQSHNYRLDEKWPRIKRSNTQIKSINSIQHQFLEFRADTASKPQRNDSIMTQFTKTKQKSNLGNKVEGQKVDITTDDRTTVDTTESGNDVNKPTLGQLARSNTQNLNGLKKINLDKFAFDAYILNPNRRFNFAHLENCQQSRYFDEIREDHFRRKADKEHWLRLNESKMQPTIVNLGIENNRPAKKPTELPLSVLKMETSNIVLSDEQTIETKHKNSTYSENGVKGKQQTKAALSRFNTLDVFGGVKTSMNNSMYEQDVSKFKNPLVKFDRRRLRTRQATRGKDDEDRQALLSRKTNEVSTVDFQFGTGEVTITRKSSGAPATPPDIEALKSPHAPPNNTEYSANTDEVSRADQNSIGP